MAKIIYKEGLEGQNRLECIEGIEIELLNGQKALICPKYAECQMFPMDMIEPWDAKEVSEIEALKKKYNAGETAVLLKCGSPAAEYVCNFHSGKHGIFVLPTLLAAMEIQDQKFDIDELAETIEGADLLRDFDSNVWSCSRYSEIYGWVANGNGGFADGNNLCGSNLSVPVILY